MTEQNAGLEPELYDTLRRIAAHYLRDESRSHTLQPTALVHEAWIRLHGIGDGVEANDAANGRDELPPDGEQISSFRLLAGRTMRRVLIDHARAKKSEKRGGGFGRVSLTAVLDDRPSGAGDGHGSSPGIGSDPVDLLALDSALRELESLDPRRAQLVELRFFAGLTNQQAADALGVARSTVAEQWRLARAWLSNRLADTDSDSASIPGSGNDA